MINLIWFYTVVIANIITALFILFVALGMIVLLINFFINKSKSKNKYYDETGN